jgi:hypothetical protein
MLKNIKEIHRLKKMMMNRIWSIHLIKKELRRRAKKELEKCGD